MSQLSPNPPLWIRDHKLWIAVIVLLLIAGSTYLVPSGGVRGAQSSAPDPENTPYRIGLADQTPVPMTDGAYVEPIYLNERMEALREWIKGDPLATSPSSHIRHSRETAQISQHVYGSLKHGPAHAVVLWESGGGSGTFFSLHLVAATKDGKLRDFADLALGDRSKILDLKIDQELIEVELIRSGPNDPMCCPTEHVRLTIDWDGADTLHVRTTEHLSQTEQ